MEDIANGEVAPRLRLTSDASPASASVRWLCLFVILLCRLEISVLTLIIPLIAREFGVSTEMAIWVNLLPTFTFTMFAPSIGAFSDRHGHVAVWRFGLLLIVLSTWLAAWSPNIPLLLVARGVTGFANCGIFSPSLPIMTRGMPPEKWGAVQSEMKTAETLGSSIGVLVGGMIADHMGWRFIFLCPAPIMTAMLLCSWYVVPATRPAVVEPADAVPVALHGQQRMVKSAVTDARGSLADFDWAGTFLFASSSFCILFAINRGNADGWGSPFIVALLIAGVVMAPLLWLVESRAKSPILPIWLFFTKVRGLLVLTLTITWACYDSSLLLVPVYLQDAMHMHPSAIGKLLAARPLAAAASTMLTARLIKSGAYAMRPLAVFGAVVQVGSYGVLMFAGAMSLGDRFYTAVEVQQLLQALGAFFCFLTTNAMFVASSPKDQLACINACVTVIAGAGSLVVQTISMSLISATGGVDEQDCYRPCWVNYVLLAGVCLVSTCFAPASVELKSTSEPLLKSTSELLLEATPRGSSFVWQEQM